MKGLSAVLYIKSSFKKEVEEYNLAPPKVTAAAPVETPLVTPPPETATPPVASQASPPETAAPPGTEPPETVIPPAAVGGHQKRKYTRKVKTQNTTS